MNVLLQFQSITSHISRIRDDALDLVAACVRRVESYYTLLKLAQRQPPARARTKTKKGKQGKEREGGERQLGAARLMRKIAVIDPLLREN
jgi:hypothetical protein